jgi:nucleotide-binding universal stress UspA family protein
MEKIDKILVGLDLTKMDESVLSYVKFINHSQKPSVIDFVNIHHHVDIPEELAADFPELANSIDNKYLEKLVTEVDDFNISNATIGYEAFEGAPLTAMLNKAYKGKYDLVVIGRKFEESASHGEVQKMLARKSASSVLLVPEFPRVEVNRILFPTDFSEHSMFSLDAAITIAKNNNASIELLNIVTVPTGYSSTGKSFEEFADIMTGHAKKAAEKFETKCKESGIEISSTFPVKDNEDDSHYIVQAARKADSDLVIVGSKGRTNLAAFFLGSTTEDIINTDLKRPLLIIKDNKKSFDFWDALKAL